MHQTLDSEQIAPVLIKERREPHPLDPQDFQVADVDRLALAGILATTRAPCGSFVPDPRSESSLTCNSSKQLQKKQQPAKAHITQAYTLMIQGEGRWYQKGPPPFPFPLFSTRDPPL